MNTSLKFGIIGGVLLSSLVFFYTLEIYEYALVSKIWTSVQLVILLIVILLGVKEKKKSLNDEITYRDAVFTGLSVNLITALIQSFSLFLLFKLSPSTLEKYKSFFIEFETEQMKKAQFATKDLVKSIEIIKTELTAFNMARANFLEILLIGLIFALVVAFFQRNKTQPEVTLKK